MSEPLAYLNGHLVPASQAGIAPYDQGFALGVTVSEQLRTFAGRIFRAEEHLQRLENSLRIVGLELPTSAAVWLAAANELAARNHRLLPSGSDLGMAWFVTPGHSVHQSPAGNRGPTFGMYTFPLPFRAWASKYTQGDHLVTSTVRQVPADCWPVELKCRSRMHYYLAEQDVLQRMPGARPLLLDQAGLVNETPTANVMVVRSEREIYSPPRANILPGITLAVVEELALDLGFEFIECGLAPEELAAADEVLLTSTPFCLLPVVRFNEQSIGQGQPGPVFAQLLKAFSALAGLNIAAQAVRYVAD